jgi:hypothetical protein
MPRRLSVKARLALFLVILLFSYAVAELACTLVLAKPAPGTPGSTTFFIWEHSGETVHFDPIRGYALKPILSRVARLTDGEIEFVGRVKGNAQGFPDADDWTIRKPPGKKRYVVFGDSFSGGTNLEVNWPDRVERLNPRLQLLNVSIDGAGLANWHNVLTRLILADGYEFDGVIFAVYPSDLRRPFTVFDHTRTSEPLLGYFGWRPERYPKTFEEALPTMFFNEGMHSQILSTDEFDAAISDRRLGGSPRKFRSPWIASQVARLFSGAQARKPILDQAGSPDELIRDLRGRLKGRPTIVVYVPTREESVDKHSNTADAREFAGTLGAKFLDGTDALADLSATEIRAGFLPHDGHWNQIGSDRFAAWIKGKL